MKMKGKKFKEKEKLMKITQKLRKGLKNALKQNFVPC